MFGTEFNIYNILISGIAYKVIEENAQFYYRIFEDELIK